MSNEYSCGCSGQVKSCSCQGCNARLARIHELQETLRRIEERLLVDVARDIRIGMGGKWYGREDKDRDRDRGEERD